jgi:DNA primase
MITKELILQKIKKEDIFSYYLNTTNFNKNIKSPFAKDKNPSLKIYKNGTFKCYSSGKQGDCWQFVADLFSLDNKREFQKVLLTINKDLNLNLNGFSVEKHFKVIHKEYSPEAIKFWANLGVNKKVLDKYNVKNTDYIEYKNKENQLKKFKIYTGVLGFDYIINKKHKVYIPAIKSKKVKKQFYKNQTKEDIFGLKELPKKTKYIIISAGEKDALVSSAFGFPAISFQSESIFPKPDIIRHLKEICNNLLICYDNDDAGKKQSKAISERYNIPIITIPEGYKDIAEYLPQNKKEAFNQLIEKSLSEHQKEKHSLVYENNFGYYKKHKTQEIELTNFIIKVIALISSETNPRRIVQLITEYNTTDPFEFSIDAFVSKNSFRKAIESIGNYFFYGNENDLMEIKRVAFSTSDITREITDLGYDYQSNSYILSNGIINSNNFKEPNKFGIVYSSDNKGLYIPSSSLLNQHNHKFKDSKKFKFLKSSVSTLEWYKQFEIVYGKSSIICLGYLMSAINFDTISNEINCFPLLNLFGPPRSGKSTLATSLLSVFGIPQDAVMLPNATQASISSKLAQLKNSFVWFDEYNNSLAEWLNQTLKGVFDLQGRLRKTFTNDNTTYSSDVNSATIITGQESPVDEALLSRCICIQFKKINFTKTLSDEFVKLRTIERKGLGNLLIELLKYRENISNRFKSTYDSFLDKLSENLKSKGFPSIQIRLLQSYSIICAALDIYMQSGFPFASNFNIQELLDIIIEQMINQIELEDENNEIKVFWNCFETLVTKGTIKEEIDFRINKDKDILAFKPLIFDAYRKYMFHSTGKWGLHKSTLQSYLKHEPYYITNKATVKFKINDYQDFVKASNAYKVSYSLLPIKLEKESNPFGFKDSEDL